MELEMCAYLLFNVNGIVHLMGISIDFNEFDEVMVGNTGKKIKQP
jgi:hypothetical protein